MFTGRKLPITLAFTVLIGLAFGPSCDGFFVDPTLTSIAVSPTAPQVEVGKTITLQAFGTYDDGTRKQVKTGVSWSSSDPTIASVDTNTGVLTGVTPGSSTITASSQALSGTATATILLTSVTAIKVDPSSGNVSKGGSGFTFTFTASSNGTDVPITTDNGGILTITPSSSDVTCAVDGDTELCTANSNAATGLYSIKMTYPGSSASATANLTVTP